jgi:hypothetical protein
MPSICTVQFRMIHHPLVTVTHLTKLLLRQLVGLTCDNVTILSGCDKVCSERLQCSDPEVSERSVVSSVYVVTHDRTHISSTLGTLVTCD